jgi:hypothetical protein
LEPPVTQILHDLLEKYARSLALGADPGTLALCMPPSIVTMLTMLHAESLLKKQKSH